MPSCGSPDDGNRITAFATNTRPSGPGAQIADLELRHRRAARCADLIRAAKDTGVENRHAIPEIREGRYRFYAIDPSGPATEVMRLLHGLFGDSLRDARSAVEVRSGTDLDAKAG